VYITSLALLASSVLAVSLMVFCFDHKLFKFAFINYDAYLIFNFAKGCAL